MVFHGAAKQTQNTVYTGSKAQFFHVLEVGLGTTYEMASRLSVFLIANCTRYHLASELCEAAGPEISVHVLCTVDMGEGAG